MTTRSRDFVARQLNAKSASELNVFHPTNAIAANDEAKRVHREKRANRSGFQVHATRITDRISESVEDAAAGNTARDTFENQTHIR